jgi:hypothetical protein
MSNPNDPLGLFSGDYQAPQPPDPAKAADGTRSATATTDWSGIVVGILITIAGILLYNRLEGDSSNGDRQHREQIDDGKGDQKQDDKQSKSAGKTLVFIHERNPQPTEHDLLLREMPGFCKTNKLQFRAFDDDMPDDPIPGLIAYAKTQGIDPPFVVLTGADDKPIRASKWPSDIDQLKKFVR